MLFNFKHNIYQEMFVLYTLVKSLAQLEQLDTMEIPSMDALMEKLKMLQYSFGTITLPVKELKLLV